LIVELPPVELPGHTASVDADESHPMRVMTRRAAGLAEGGWDPGARQQVTSAFDALAAEWHTRVTPERNAVVADALERGTIDAPGGLAVEVGSGIGTYTGMLARRWGAVLAVDLSLEMLRHSPPAPGWRVQADASRLPLADRKAAAIVLVNAFLFPAEVDRVLAPGGVVVWVNSSGERTPIHLPAAEVADVLPGEWDGVAARAGIGIWCVLRRLVPSTG
jgi:SAM-dependent methyltransferase